MRAGSAEAGRRRCFPAHKDAGKFGLAAVSQSASASDSARRLFRFSSPTISWEQGNQPPGVTYTLEEVGVRNIVSSEVISVVE